MWNQLLRTVINTTLVMAIGTGQVVAPAASGWNVDEAAEATIPTLELVNMPADFAHMAWWAIDLFDQAGLELPPLRYVHHDGDRTPCSGRDGLHHEVDGVSVIELCATEAVFGVQVMVLHETAHAWADHSLTDERKLAFQELRGWEHWRNYQAAEWHENGTEQAAEIIVWGLIDRPIRMIRIDQTSCDDLTAGYLTLTGQAPLHGYRDHCEVRS